MGERDGGERLGGRHAGIDWSSLLDATAAWLDAGRLITRGGFRQWWMLEAGLVTSCTRLPNGMSSAFVLRWR